MRISNRGLLAASALCSRTLGAESINATSSSLNDAVSSSATNLGDYIAAGLDLEKAETQSTSTNPYALSNATSTASLLSQANSGPSSGSTSYANTTSDGVSTATKSSTTSLLSLATDGTFSSYGSLSNGASLNASLLSLATGATSALGTQANATLLGENTVTISSTASLLSLAKGGTSSHTDVISNGTSTASLFPLATGGTAPLGALHANATLAGGNTVTIPLTSYVTSCRPSSTDSRGVVWSDCDTEATLVTQTFTNTSWAFATDADQCWTEWVSYWSLHPPSSATISVITNYLPVVIDTVTYLTSFGSYITDQTITSTSLSTAPTEANNGGFTTTMSKVVVTHITLLTTTYSTASSISTSLSLFTRTPQGYNFTTISASNHADWPAPSCTLPPVYSDCQSQWEDYATHNGAVAPPPWSGK
jgi:hypothetical protein